jgi:hypothetical protein
MLIANNPSWFEFSAPGDWLLFALEKLPVPAVAKKPGTGNFFRKRSSQSRAEKQRGRDESRPYGSDFHASLKSVSTSET